MTIGYPFAAIVGQQRLKTALMLVAINPSIGGLLIRGDKGTAKSTAARALAEIMAPIERVVGCHYNCQPGHPHPICSICTDPKSDIQLTPVPFINLPLGATEDRVIGSLDFEKALKDGQRAFQPGLLASCHRGILYIDEVNLLADHLVDVLLDVAAMGTNSIQREGLSISHPARFSFIGTMNPEEGDLRPQLLDRFGMMIEIEAPNDAKVRAEVVRRRLQFEADADAFALNWQIEQDLLRKQISVAQKLLINVTLSDELLHFISNLCCEFEVASLRADIVMNKAARAHAALSARTTVIPEDIQTAAELVLPHRKRRKPSERPGLDKDRLQDLMNNPPSPPPSSESNEQETNDDLNNENTPDQLFGIAAPTTISRIQIQSDSISSTSGRRTTGHSSERGQYIQAVANENPKSLAVDATIRHAVLRNNGKLNVTREDFHEKVRTSKNAALILFVVDTSGSMSALKQMETVKGTVISLLDDAYQRRDQVSVISFRGQQAELLLPPTRSIEIAQEKLSNLPTGGRTPLAHALEMTYESLMSCNTKSGPEPLIVLLTDGRSNVPLSSISDPWQDTLNVASKLCEQGYPTIVIDTEAGYVKIGRAGQLAAALGAQCISLDAMSSQSLLLTIRSCLANRSKRTNSGGKR